MINFITTIGIETHVALNTKTKLFSDAANSHVAPNNSLVSFMDLALPGILPLCNEACVHKAIILAEALKMQINHDKIIFDRKNYFYQDLPKGYQITQQFFPIGTNGNINITVNNEQKKIAISRIHLEEDTAKQSIIDNKLCLDYNRAGSPLIEIVTEPCMHSAEDVMQYLNTLKRILIYKNISDAKLEDGSLRADVNISVSLVNSNTLGTRVEIKNINSISNVGKAIEFEVKRQISLLINNQSVNQETRRFNDVTNQTEFMRDKSNAIDYRYMTDPNVSWFSIDKKTVNDIINNSPPGPEKIEKQLLDLGLETKNIELLLDNQELCLFFLSILEHVNDVRLVFSWTVVELIGILNKNNLSIGQLKPLYLNNFIELLKLLKQQEINAKQAKTLIEEIFIRDKMLGEIINELGFIQIKDPNIILPIIQSHIDLNKDLVAQYAERPERVEKFLVGMVMRDTNAQANPVLTMELVKQQLSK